jgi:hypothetical protein
MNDGRKCNGAVQNYKEVVEEVGAEDVPRSAMKCSSSGKRPTATSWAWSTATASYDWMDHASLCDVRD